jgi:thiamine-phosphate pyrophosphorylase
MNDPPRLLAISGPLDLPPGEFDRWLEGLGAAGVDAVQLRDKGLDDRRLYELTRRARAVLPARCRLLVNGRLDVALAAGADGVHLPADGLPSQPLRRRFGPGVLIGRSTHRPEEVAQARRAGADYATFGPVFPTPSKAGYGPPPGLAGLRRAAAVGLPVLALGGITAERLAEVARAGAAGAAARRAFADAAGAAAMVRRAAGCFPPEL